MKKSLRHLSLLSAAVIIGFGGLQGCGDDPVNVPVLNDSEVMFVHGAADAGTVDIVVDDEIVASSVTLGQTTTGYLDVDEGMRRIRVTPPANLAGALIDQTIDFDETKHYTAFAVTDANSNPSLLLFEDDLTEPAAGKALIRLVNLIPDAPHVRLGIPQSQSKPIVDSIDFMEVANFFQQIDAQTATFAIANADGGGGGGSVPKIVPNFTQTLEDGGIYTVVLVGKISDSTTSSFVIKHEHD